MVLQVEITETESYDYGIPTDPPGIGDFGSEDPPGQTAYAELDIEAGIDGEASVSVKASPPAFRTRSSNLSIQRSPHGLQPTGTQLSMCSTLDDVSSPGSGKVAMVFESVESIVGRDERERIMRNKRDKYSIENDDKSLKNESGKARTPKKGFLGLSPFSESNVLDYVFEHVESFVCRDSHQPFVDDEDDEESPIKLHQLTYTEPPIEKMATMNSALDPPIEKVDSLNEVLDQPIEEKETMASILESIESANCHNHSSAQPVSLPLQLSPAESNAEEEGRKELPTYETSSEEKSRLPVPIRTTDSLLGLEKIISQQYSLGHMWAFPTEDVESGESRLEKIRKKKRMIEQQISSTKHTTAPGTVLVPRGYLHTISSSTSATTASSGVPNIVSTSNEETSADMALEAQDKGRMWCGVIILICILVALILFGMSFFWPLR